MGIYINGAELPESCWRCALYKTVDCAISRREESAGAFRNIRHSNCPLIEVKEPHGRLIDADEVGWAKYNPDTGYFTPYQQGWNDGVDRTLREIDDTPTVIEGSE